MTGNIVSAISQVLTPDLLSKMASTAGISEVVARRAVGAATPAILSGMAVLASKPEGAQSLAKIITAQSPGMLDTFASSVGNSSELSNMGRNVLTSLFGSSSFGSLASAIAKFTGLGDGAVNSLLGMLTPAILGVLGREAGTGATGLKQLFSSQKDQIAAAMPGGLADALRTSGFLKRASPAASAANRAGDTYRVARESVGTMARAAGAPATHSMHWAFWALPLAILAGLLWFLFGRDRGNPPDNVAPTAVAIQSAKVGAPAGDELGHQIITAVDSLNSSLQGVKDKVLATEAFPRLQQANSEFERLNDLASRLPVDSRNQLTQTINSASTRLKSTLDTVNALPDAPTEVKAAIAGLQNKLDGLLTVAQSTSAQGKAVYISTNPRGAASVGTYMNRDVYNNAGEKIGVIKDLIVNPDGSIGAAVIGVGGFLGIGEKDVAVTFSSIRTTQHDNDRQLVADATKDALKEAPSYRTTDSK